MFVFKSGKDNSYVEIVDIENVFISEDSGITFKKYRNLDGLRGIEERIIHCEEWELQSIWKVAENFNFTLLEDQFGDVFITEHPQFQGCSTKEQFEEEYGEYL